MIVCSVSDAWWMYEELYKICTCVLNSKCRCYFKPKSFQGSINRRWSWRRRISTFTRGSWTKDFLTYYFIVKLCYWDKPININIKESNFLWFSLFLFLMYVVTVCRIGTIHDRRLGVNWKPFWIVNNWKSMVLLTGGAGLYK